jgi:putative YhbY family RNA-binding protein
MPTLASAERRALRARAHHLEPVVSIGQQGLTPAVLAEIEVALKAHELIKIRVHSDSRTEREAMLASIAESLACAPVQHLGKLLIVWRENPDKAAVPAAVAPRPAAARPGPGADARRRRRSPAAGPAAMPYLSRRGAGRMIAATPKAGMVRKRGRGG